MLVYTITNTLNNKIYVGQTTRSLEVRWSEHKAAIKYRNEPLYRAMRKYGVGDFRIQQIDTANSLEELNKKEAYYIKLYRKNGIYNVDLGGRNHKRSETTKLKMSTNKRGKKNPGVSISNKHRIGMAKSNVGYFGNTNRVGKKMSETSKAVISKSLLGNNRRSRSIVCINTGVLFISIVEAARVMSLDSRSIHRVLSGEYRHTKGYFFKYEG